MGKFKGLGGGKLGDYYVAMRRITDRGRDGKSRRS